jgi:hypothetical protein
MQSCLSYDSIVEKTGEDQQHTIWFALGTGCKQWLLQILRVDLIGKSLSTRKNHTLNELSVNALRING